MMKEHKSKILFVTSPPMSGIKARNGVDRYTEYLVSALSGPILFRYVKSSIDLCMAKVDVPKSQRIDTENKHYGVVKRTNHFKLFAGYVKDIFLLVKSIRREAYDSDLIHVNRIGCEVDAIAARLASRLPVVGTIHNLPGVDSFAWHPVRRIVEWFSVHAAHHLIAVSEETKREWVARTGVNEKRISVIYNGMPPVENVTSRAEVRTSLGVNNDVFCIGICARLHRMKGHEVLFNALHALKKTADYRPQNAELGGEAEDYGCVDGGRWTVGSRRWGVDSGQWTVDGGQWTEDPGLADGYAGRGAKESQASNLQASTINTQPKFLLLIAGEGPLEAQLKQQVVDFGLEDCVRFVGFVEKPLSFLAALDLQVLPSVELECLPYSIVEGMHVGIPTVCSDVGGTKEIVTASGGGSIVPANDSIELARVLALYIDDQERCHHEGLAAQAYARKHLTATIMAEKTLAVYDSLACRRDKGY